MTLTFQPADEDAIRAFVRWRYAPPYDVYNLQAEETEALVRYFLDPALNCYAVQDEGGALVAYCTFGPDGQVPGWDYSRDGLDIGLGVRPDLTGQGRGATYVAAVVDFAWRRFGPRAARLRVAIAAFNVRAQRVWEKAGFRQVGRFEREVDGMGFVVMERQG